jgi:hypothetical protein
MLMIVMLVGMGLAVLMLPLVLTQTGTTTFDATRGKALQAAESGIDIVVGQIRAATSSVGIGDPTKLPCGPLSGTADPVASSTYTATITYYKNDPAGHAGDATWITSNQVQCQPASWAASGAPRFVSITATGVDTRVNRTRTLHATYVLSVPVYTGYIRLFNDPTLCLTSTGDKNQAPSLAICGSNPANQQFQAAADGRIVLASQSWCIRTNGGSGSVVVGECTGSWISLPSISDPLTYVQLSMTQPNGSIWCVNSTSISAGAVITANGCSALSVASAPGTLQAWLIDLDANGNVTPSDVASMLPGIRDLHEK